MVDRAARWEFWPSPCSSPWSNGGLQLSHPLKSSLREITEQSMETSSALGKALSPWFVAWSTERAQTVALLLKNKFYQ